MNAVGAGLVAGALAGLAVALAQGAPPAVARRRIACRPAADAAGADPPGGSADGAPGGRSAGPLPGGSLLAAASVAIALGYVLVGPAGAALAALAFAGSARRVIGSGGREVRRRRARIVADLPRAADLFAACLVAGSAPPDAAEAVADAVGGPVGESLRRVVALLRLGGDPARCWAGLGVEPALAPLGRAVARAVDSGTSLAPVVAAEAAQFRLGRRLAAEAALARVGVYATAPLGLCFLPAFVLIGIVPVVVGLGTGVLS